MDSRADYRELVASRPELFSNPPGAAFEILLDEDEIKQAETVMETTLADAGGSPEWARVGVAFRDQYVMIVRDAVRYVDGSLGTYIRMVDLYPGVVGVAILPICRDEVLLIRHFRHATRTWHLEIPRGFGMSADSAVSARNELREELGGEAVDLESLGDMYPDAGASRSRVALFLARLETYGAPEAREGITEIRSIPVADFERMIADGVLDDAFALAVYARAKARGLL